MNTKTWESLEAMSQAAYHRDNDTNDKTAATTITIVVLTLLSTNYLPAWCRMLYILFS